MTFVKTLTVIHCRQQKFDNYGVGGKFFYEETVAADDYTLPLVEL